MRIKKSLTLGLILLSIGASAQSRILAECDIDFESGRFNDPGRYTWAIKFCDVREETYKKWDAKVQKLDMGWQELSHTP